MAMSDTPLSPRSVTLSLPREEQWTLHHVLLDRIEREALAEEPGKIDPPPIEIFQAFATLEAGETSFTLEQLDAMQTVVAEYHHSPDWGDVERARIERLLHRVTEPIERQRVALPAPVDDDSNDPS